LVEVSGTKGKPSRTVREGQVIRIQSPTRLLEVRIVKIPKGSVSKSEAVSLYEVIRDERRNWEI
jgi:ribosomal 50S subunit-recycling heat shock protein